MIKQSKKLAGNVTVIIHVLPRSAGRMIYIYPEKDLRAYPGTLRGTEE